MDFTKDQQNAYDLIMSGNNTCLLGIAGSGKSFLINAAINMLEESGKSVCVAAPTGIAAINIGGTTLHRLLRISPKTKLGPYPDSISSNTIEMLSKCDVLIVDEISMCRCDLFDYLVAAINRANRLRNKNIQIICVGDFYQLPPVITKYDKVLLEEHYGKDIEGYAFQAKNWNTLNFKYVNMYEPVRQKDCEFVNALNKARSGDISGIDWIYKNSSTSINENAIILCSTNSQVDGENKRKINMIPNQQYAYTMIGNDIDRYIKDVPVPKDLVVCVGARVMATVNDPEGSYQNGTMGTVTNVYKDNIEVEFDNDELVLLSRHTFDIIRPKLIEGKIELEAIASLSQFPLKLAYAMTMHKSQGLTLDSVHIYPNAFMPGQLYTAISRVRNVKDISFATRPMSSSLITSKSILDFSKSI